MRLRERGAGAVEYLGVLVVAVLLVGGLTMTSAGSVISAYIDQGICRVGSAIGGGSCEGEGPDAADLGPDFEPDSCTVSTSGQSEKVDVSIAIIDGGGSHGVEIAEIRHADGTVEYAVSQTGEGNLGVGVGIGAKGEGGDDSPEGKLSGDIGVSGSYSGGPTYTVDSLEDAQALQQQLMSNPFADVGRTPTSETTTWGGEAEGSIDLGIGLGGDDGGSGGTGGTGGPDDGSSADEAKLSGALNGSHEFSTTVNADGTTQYTTSWSGEISGEANASDLAGTSGTWSGSTSVQITRDADGQIVNITFSTVTESGSSLSVGGDELSVSGAEGVDVVTTSSLPVTDANRAIVESWMGDQAAGENYMGLAPLGTIFWDPTRQSSDPMVNLLYQEAQITQVSMENWEDSTTFGGEVKWGIKLGASYTYTDSEGNVIDAQYAGAPAGGQRPWQNMEVCFS